MSSNHPDRIDRNALRAWFPALKSDTVFLENAGGSQVPATVADRIRDYMLGSYVQLDADYALSQKATRIMEEAHAFAGRLMNADPMGKVAFGHSCSMLIRMLADCYGDILLPGDEIVVAESGHEANVGPWLRLAEKGLRLRQWKLDPQNAVTCPLETLEPLLNDRTRIVAFPHVSNLLGEIVDIDAIVKRVHGVGGRVVVDGVAYAPHRAMDVAAWDVDWYAYSAYKVYGPHMGVLYGKDQAFAEIEGPNHYFVPRDEIPYKFELGGVCHESCSGLLGLCDYLTFLAGGKEGEPLDRSAIEAAFETMALLELPLQERLIQYLLTKEEVRLIGPSVTDSSRVGTVSFVHERLSSLEIARAANEKKFGIRNGHMYAHRLCKAFGLDPDDGVVRVSLVHYNTLEEIEALIECFEELL